MADRLEILEVVVLVSILVIWGVLRLANRGRVVDARMVKSVGSLAGIDVSVASSVGGRRYVALRYEVTTDDKVREVELLLSSANARRLAELLEIAVSPGKTLLQARVAARRKSAAKGHAQVPAGPA